MKAYEKIIYILIAALCLVIITKDNVRFISVNGSYLTLISIIIIGLGCLFIKYKFELYKSRPGFISMLAFGIFEIEIMIALFIKFIQ